MFEKFTKEAREAVIDAQRYAVEGEAAEIGTRHLLAALASRNDPTAELLAEYGVTSPALPARGTLSAQDQDALRSLGIDLDAVRDAVESAFGTGALDRPAKRHTRRPWRRGGIRHIPFSHHAKKALELSLRESIRLRGGEIRADHIALGVLRSEDPALAGLGIDVPRLRESLEARLRGAA